MRNWAAPDNISIMKYYSQWQGASCPWLPFKNSSGIANVPWKISTTLLHTRETWSVTKWVEIMLDNSWSLLLKMTWIATVSTHCHAQSHPQPVLNEVCSDTLNAKYRSICQTSWKGFTAHTPRTISSVLAIIYLLHKGYELLTKGYCIMR